ncbi:Predicted arabinose efflux permease, MFS family [Chitinophaga costaii]|uniref:Predicted arabinose efflux permease, MFS family n=1 Tax=Chitinophaga costaii TaxID=1335309 RepID=A0A1C4FVE4_9BACT|nr:MFS transporter [Chitinophaga costaii]PUZ27321.1 MFS transporter [Chitinophaga costaii]SCC59890.1 Predicted arabinose efflux permease, MFS family [Chitinophaga costaii]
MALKKSTILIMAVCTGLIVANIYYSQPLLSLIQRDFHITESEAGQVTFFTQMGYAMGLLFCVPLGDMLERKKQIIIMGIFSTLALAASAVAPNPDLLKTAGFFIGFTSIIPQLIIPMAAHLADAKERGGVIGTIMSGLLVGILLSRTLSGFVGKYWGWQVMFAIAAGITLAMVILMAVTFPSSKPSYNGSYGQLMKSLLHLIKTEPLLREATAISMCSFAMFGLFWTTLTFLLSAPPFSYKSDVIGSMGLAAAAGALCAPLIGKIADNKNPRIAVGYGIGFVFLGFFLFYFFRTHIFAILLGIVAIDLGQQGIHVSNQTRIYALNPAARNRLNTVYMTFSFIGTATGSAIGLWVWPIGHWPGVCLAAVLLMCIALSIYLLTYKKDAAIEDAGFKRA